MRQPALPMLMAGDTKHGTIYAYQFHGCRCPACVEAIRTYNRDYARDRRKARGLKPRGGSQFKEKLLNELAEVDHALDPWQSRPR